MSGRKQEDDSDRDPAPSLSFPPFFQFKAKAKDWQIMKPKQGKVDFRDVHGIDID
jgi:hypothetical protein